MGVCWQLGAVSHDLAQANAAFLGFPDQNSTLETLFLMPTGTPDLRPGLPLALSLRLALPRANGTTTFLDCGHPVSAAELRSERGTPPRLPPTVGRWEAGELFFGGEKRTTPAGVAHVAIESWGESVPLAATSPPAFG